MNDRELLELAAKAVGLKLLRIDVLENGYTESVREGFNPNGGNIWNPLHNDADAFRLAVKLKIHMSTFDDAIGIGFKRSQNDAQYFEQPIEGDSCAALRRGVVRAAAYIGERIPEAFGQNYRPTGFDAL